MMKKKSKNIPKKNYFYAILTFAIIIVLVLYGFSWYNVKKEERLMKSYLISSKTITSKITDINTLKQSLTEAPLSYFVILSYTNDEEIYKLEKNLKRVIDKYKLNDIFYYVDVTKNIDNKDFINNLNKVFNTKNIDTYPVLIYVEEGKTKEVLNDFKIDEFKELLNNNNFEIVK